MDQCNSMTQKKAQGITGGYTASPWKAAELRCAAAMLLDAEGRAATAVHHHTPSDLV